MRFSFFFLAESLKMWDRFLMISPFVVAVLPFCSPGVVCFFIPMGDFFSSLPSPAFSVPLRPLPLDASIFLGSGPLGPGF